ncbi:MAG: 30S ribosomal protein S15 [Bacteroidetes bacterium]|nr:30S ribosomal protein S15 [Bacteroidota bacterium]
MFHLTAEAKKTLFATYGGTEKNTGSIEAQVAMLTERINRIAGVLELMPPTVLAQHTFHEIIVKEKNAGSIPSCGLVLQRHCLEDLLKQGAV